LDNSEEQYVTDPFTSPLPTALHPRIPAIIPSSAPIRTNEELLQLLQPGPEDIAPSQDVIKKDVVEVEDEDIFDAFEQAVKKLRTGIHVESSNLTLQRNWCSQPVPSNDR
jgi:hypothetical protein